MALVVAIYRYPIAYAARIRLVIIASAVPAVASAAIRQASVLPCTPT